MKRLFFAVLIAAALVSAPAAAADNTTATTAKIDAAIQALIEAKALLNEIPLPPVSTITTVQPPVPVPARSDINPYADSEIRTPITPDDHLAFIGSASYLQSRFWRVLWDIADKMRVRLVVVNACLLEGVPANNTAHDPDGRTVDLRYLPTDSASKELIGRILASFPVYDPAVQYAKWATDESEVRVSPEIRDRLKLPWIKRVQADPAGNHNDHLHVRFGQ